MNMFPPRLPSGAFVSRSDPRFDEWARAILAHFRHCYADPNMPSHLAWRPDHVIIDEKRDPVLHANQHAGVCAIRRFYPSFTPRRDQFFIAKGAGR
jgi:hypothetical protein